MNDTRQANIGVVGLAVMGVEPRPQPGQPRGQHGRGLQPHHGADRRPRARAPRGGLRRGRRRSTDFVASLARPRTAIIMVQAGAGTDAVIEQLAERFEEGDIIVDGGNADFHDTIRRERQLRETRPQLRRRRHLRRRGGRAPRTVDHARRLRRGVARPSARSCARSPRSPRASPASPTSATDGAGPLREDGPQRHRVRRHAADRGVLRPAAPRRRPRAGRDRRRLRRVERAAT